MFEPLFRVIRRQPTLDTVEHEEVALDAETSDLESDAGEQDEWSPDDIEAAYLKALEAADAADATAEETIRDESGEEPMAVDLVPAAEETPAVSIVAAASALQKSAQSGPTSRQVLEAILFVGGTVTSFGVGLAVGCSASGASG